MCPFFLVVKYAFYEGRSNNSSLTKKEERKLDFFRQHTATSFKTRKTYSNFCLNFSASEVHTNMRAV